MHEAGAGARCEMPREIPDYTRKKIVADYLDTQSVNLAAKRNGVAWCTARKVLDEMGDIESRLEEKKAQNTADILAYMDGRREKICEIIEEGLEALPKKIRDARSAVEVTTAIGTLIDKWTAIRGLSEGGGGGVIILPDVGDGDA